MGVSAIKNPRRIFSQAGSGGGGADPALDGRVTNLENNEYKILYFETIGSTTGVVTKPTDSTILLDQFYSGGDAIVETLVNGQPTGQSPLTIGGSVVSVISFDINGNFVLSGTPSSYPICLIYLIKIKAVNYSNINLQYEINMEREISTITIDSTIIDGSPNPPSGNAVYDALILKGDGTIKGALVATSGLIPFSTGVVNTIQGSSTFSYDLANFIAQPTNSIKHQIGTISTNAMYRLDSVGFRVGSVSDAGTSNTSKFQIPAGSTTVAPFKMTSGTNLTTPQAGAIEFDGSFFYITPNATRYKVQTSYGMNQNGGVAFVNGDVWAMASEFNWNNTTKSLVLQSNGTQTGISSTNAGIGYGGSFSSTGGYGLLGTTLSTNSGILCTNTNSSLTSGYGFESRKTVNGLAVSAGIFTVSGNTSPTVGIGTFIDLGSNITGSSAVNVYAKIGMVSTVVSSGAARAGYLTFRLTDGSTGDFVEPLKVYNNKINLLTVTTPSTLADGDIWFDNVNLYIRIAGVTKTFTLI
jgi:hypothetical protein